jgi:hypothetical protein
LKRIIEEDKETKMNGYTRAEARATKRRLAADIDRARTLISGAAQEAYRTVDRISDFGHDLADQYSGLGNDDEDRAFQAAGVVADAADLAAEILARLADAAKILRGE